MLTALTFISFLLSVLLKIIFVMLKMGTSATSAATIAAVNTTHAVGSKAVDVASKGSPGSKNAAKIAKHGARLAKMSVVAIVKTVEAVMQILIMVVDAICAALMAAWGIAIVVVVLITIAILGAWFVVVGDDDTALELAEHSMTAGADRNSDGIPDTRQSAGGTIDYDEAITGLPTIASSNNIPQSLVQMSMWAMKNRPENCFRYGQGNTDYCHYDCSTWVTALLESSGWRIDWADGGRLKPREGDRYIIGKNQKSDLHNYGVSGVWGRTGEGTIHFTPKSAEDLEPGDIMSNGGHIQIYVGKVNGKHVISNASTVGAVTYEDPQLTKQTSDVGFQEFNLSAMDSFVWTRIVGF